MFDWNFVKLMNLLKTIGQTWQNINYSATNMVKTNTQLVIPAEFWFHTHIKTGFVIDEAGYDADYGPKLYLKLLN